MTITPVAAFPLLVVMFACTGPQPHDTAKANDNRVRVVSDVSLQETHFKIQEGDCWISWTVYGSEANRGVIRQRSDCGLTLSEQAPLVEEIWRSVRAVRADAGFRTLSWGRLYGDGARDSTMAKRLAIAAAGSGDWDPAKGRPRSGDINGFVRVLANNGLIYRELSPVFQRSGHQLQVATVEKVLVSRADRLPFFEELRRAGVKPGDKMPFDCQTWFSVQPNRLEQTGY